MKARRRRLGSPRRRRLGSPRRRRLGSPQRWALLCVALTPGAALCLFDPIHFASFRPVKLAVAWLGVGMGMGAILSGAWRTQTFGRPRDLLPWLALLGWGSLSLLWSPAPGLGLLQLATLALGLAVLMLTGAALEGEALEGDAPGGDAPGELGSRGGELGSRRQGVLLAWLAAGVACSLVALFQRIWGWRLGVHQVTGTLGNPNLVATVLLLLVPCGLALVRGGESRRLRLLGVVSMLLLFAGIWATRCRAVWIALSAMGMCWLITSPWRLRTRVLAASGLGALLVSLAVVWQAPLHRELAGRLWLARVSLGTVGSNPFFGSGLGGYPSEAAWSQAALLGRNGGSWTNLLDAHNQPLMTLAELGPLGLVGLLSVLFIPIRRCLRSQRDPVARAAAAAWAGLGVMGLSETVLLSPVVVLLGFGWLALGCMVPGRGVPGRKARQSASPPQGISPVGSLLRPLTGVGAAGLVVAGLWVSCGHLGASYHLGRGLALASRVDPSRSEATRLRLAVASYDTGLLYAWDRSRLLLNRAIALRELGHLERARRDMEASFRLVPSPERALFLGDLALGRQRNGEAISWYRVAIRLHPRYARGYNNLGVAYLRAGRVARACRFLRRALSLRPFDHSIRSNWKRHCRRP